MPDRPEPYRATVVRTEQLTPHLVRVVLTHPDFATYPDSGFSDRYCKLLFPRPDGAEGTIYRTYTVRWADPAAAEVAIDFVTHGDSGVAAPWAMAARPGDELVMSTPGGAYRPSPDVDHHLLAGDGAALPAIASALEDMPAGASATVIVQVPGPADELPLPTPADATVTWVHSEDPADLAAAVVAAELPAGRVQAFVHGELLAVRSLRKHLAVERGIERELISLSGYWRQGKDEDGFQAEKRELTAADRAAAGD